MEKIKIGDKVRWRGSFGTDAEKIAVVTGIELCEKPYDKYGDAVEEVNFEDKERCIFDVEYNSQTRWAYGFQIDIMHE